MSGALTCLYEASVVEISYENSEITTYLRIQTKTSHLFLHFSLLRVSTGLVFTEEVPLQRDSHSMQWGLTPTALENKADFGPRFSR